MVLLRSSASEKRGRASEGQNRFILRPKTTPGIDSAILKPPILIPKLTMLIKIENFGIFLHSNWAWPFGHDAAQMVFASWTLFDQKGIKGKLIQVLDL